MHEYVWKSFSFPEHYWITRSFFFLVIFPPLKNVLAQLVSAWSCSLPNLLSRTIRNDKLAFCNIATGDNYKGIDYEAIGRKHARLDCHFTSLPIVCVIFLYKESSTWLFLKAPFSYDLPKNIFFILGQKQNKIWMLPKWRSDLNVDPILAPNGMALNLANTCSQFGFWQLFWCKSKFSFDRPISSFSMDNMRDLSPDFGT